MTNQRLNVPQGHCTYTVKPDGATWVRIPLRNHCTLHRPMHLDGAILQQQPPVLYDSHLSLRQSSHLAAAVRLKVLPEPKHRPRRTSTTPAVAPFL